MYVLIRGEKALVPVCMDTTMVSQRRDTMIQAWRRNYTIGNWQAIEPVPLYARALRPFHKQLQ